MTWFRRQAVFQLGVALIAALAVAAIFLATGQIRPALAGFAFLALGGLARVWTRERPEVEDERDAAIQRKASLLAYTIFWLGFVAWGVSLSLVFGSNGKVPLEAVEPVVWTGAWLVIAVRAAAVLVRDSRGS